MQEKILIVDDEIDIVELLQDYFTLNGYETLTATSAEEAIRKAEKRPDLILLDIGMPGLDGLQVCAKIRNFVSCPIVFLTARIEESDKLQGFGRSGDDYIVKPFSIDELGARVAAHLRREKRKQRCSRIKFDDDLAIDYTERAVYYQNKPLNLAKKEFDIVELLSQHAGQVFDKERIWGYDSEGDSTVVAEHIRRVRAKFAAAGMKPVIETVWGVGYKWVL